jgi:hypothetical protein
VARIGEERQAAGEDAPHGLDHEDDAAEDEGQDQRAPLGAAAGGGAGSPPWRSGVRVRAVVPVAAAQRRRDLAIVESCMFVVPS